MLFDEVAEYEEIFFKFVQQIFLKRSLGIVIITEKSANTCIEWYFQNAEGIDLGSRYEQILIL